MSNLPADVAFERLHKLAEYGWVPRLGATTMPDVIQLDHIRVRSTTVYSHGRVTVSGFEGYRSWNIDPRDDMAFTDMLRTVGKATRSQRWWHEAGARLQVFLIFSLIPLALVLVTRWLFGAFH